MKKKHRIVVVDDDEAQAHLLEDFLGSNGYEIQLAFTGQEGLIRIMDMQPDLVILDQVLPDMTGSDICAQMRSSSAMRHIPIILCSAHKFSAFDKVIGLRSGADDYMVRPLDLSELLARIEAIIRRASVHPRQDTLAGIHAIIGKSTSPAPLAAPALAPITKPTPLIQSHPVSSHKDVPPAFGAPNVFKRAWQILNHPWESFAHINEHEDFFTAVILVLGTPILASFVKLVGPTASFDSWIGGFSLGVVLQLLMWFGVAGALHMTLPFQGVNLPMRKALIVAGLSVAPRFLESLLRLLYLCVASLGLYGEQATFSAGLDVFMSSPTSGLATFFSHIGIFDLWSTALTLIGVWELSNSKRPRWNTVTIIVGIICLLFSAFSAF